MYSIPPGGFRHPYPALAMNASMSRWVLAGTRHSPRAFRSWQWVFGIFPEDNAGLSPAAASAMGGTGATRLCTGTDQPQEGTDGPRSPRVMLWGKSDVPWAQGTT